MAGSGSDMGALMALSDQSKVEKKIKEEEQKIWGGINKGMKSVEGVISGKTKTPATVVEEEAKAPIKEKSAAQKVFTSQPVADAISIFTGTLASKLLERLKKGLNPSEDPGTSWSLDPTGKVVFNPGADAAKVIMADLATVSIKSGGQVNLLDNYSSFIDNSKYVMPDTNVIDAGFRRAIEEKMSISEAMEKNLLKGNWTVGKIGEADGFNDCNGRFSLTNIKKLRRARIVPLGLDIAATKIFNKDPELGNKDYTLKEIVDGFNQEGSPFYHLVDPNWVLSVPQFFCEARGYGAVPLGGSNQRQEVCVDMQDCLKTDEKGQCLGWGYCTREKNIWRFGGDECSKQYESCSIYKNTATNQEKSFVKNTIDFNGCDQNNVGCKWHCKNYGPKPVDNKEILTWTCDQPRMVSQTITHTCDLGEPCQENCVPTPKKPCHYPANGGCICSIPGIAEICDVPYGGGSTCVITTTTNTLQQQRSNAIYFNKNISACSNDHEGCHEYIQTTINSGVNLIPNGSFESYSVKNDGSLDQVNGWNIEGGTFLVDPALAYSGKVVAKVSAPWGNPQINPDAPLPLVAGQKYTFSVWVNPAASTALYLYVDNPVSGGAAIRLSTQAVNPGWQRLVYTFDYPLVATNNLKDDNGLVIANGTELNVRTLRWEPGDATVVYFDDFQLEPGANTTSYKEYGSVNKIYLKSAPDYLKCETDEEDPIKCANFTKKCGINQVGCELYTNVSSNSAFPAIVKNQDKCPSDCVGYNTFRQSETNFEPAVSFINFIPATGKTCSVSDSGCEEFTNLDEVTKGGEGKEYYSYLRVCRKPDTACGYFYTWVGSDTTGYQLKKYQLQVDATAPAEVFAQTIAELKWGRCQTQEDAIANPRCKEFYDAQGAISYRLYENTVSCSDDCHPLRKTKSVEADYCPNIVAGAAIPGAVYDTDTKTCTYMAIPSEGVSCGKVNVGCREYKGNNANNMKNLFNDQFETIDNDTGLWSAVAPSAESTNLGGHSILVTNSTSRSVKDLVKKDKSYLLTMWVKGAGNYTAKLGTDLFFSKNNTPKTINSDEWQEIKLGPVNLSEVINLPESLTISGPSTVFYLDNIVLKEITSNIYLIKDFWKTRTPAVCDRDYNNNSAPGFMVGCDSYKDRAGKFSYLKSFSSLCPDDKVGCDIVINTHNSSSPFSQEFNKILSDTQNPDYANIPVDNVNYLVIDPKKTCQTEFKGCQRFGLPTLDIDGAVVGWSDQYLKNDPDLYDRRPILCDQKGEGCEEFFDASANSKSYFRDPKDRLCEYRKNVNLVSEVKSGWFKKGTNQACYYNIEPGPNQGKPYQPDGLTYGIYWAGENNYDNWVGACPSNQNGCTSFVDTQTTAILNLVKNGDFEDGLTLTSPWYDATPYDYVKNNPVGTAFVTVGTISAEGENKLLS
ncbi:MAG: carbohydrate binding domain-containing protein, partial [Patescibacteria group bacterium]